MLSSHFGCRGLRVGRPAASRGTLLFLARSRFSVGVGALGRLSLAHLAFLLVVFGSGRLPIRGLVSSGARSVKPQTKKKIKKVKLNWRRGGTKTRRASLGDLRYGLQNLRD